MRRNTLICILILLMNYPGRTQTGAGAEMYMYVKKGQPVFCTPVIHYRSQSKWYTELRYNYDYSHTVSIFGGRTFSKESTVSYGITPMAGIIAGQSNAIATGVEIELKYRNIGLSSLSQYSWCAQTCLNNFAFNWSELDWEISPLFYSGISAQYIHQKYEKGIIEPGLLAGITIKNWSLPVYMFNPFNNDCYFVIGVCWQWKNHSSVKPGLPEPFRKGNVFVWEQ